MRIMLSDPAKNGLEGGAWINGYNYQNKDKNITITKNKSPLFFLCSFYQLHYRPCLLMRCLISAMSSGVVPTIGHAF